MATIRKVDAGLFVIEPDSPPSLLLLGPDESTPTRPGDDRSGPGTRWPVDPRLDAIPSVPKPPPPPVIEPDDHALFPSVWVRLHLMEFHGFPSELPRVAPEFYALGLLILRHGDRELVENLHAHFHANPAAVFVPHVHAAKGGEKKDPPPGTGPSPHDPDPGAPPIPPSPPITEVSR